MMNLSNLGEILKNKKIVLGVSGSISAYKSPEILRRLQKLGAKVKVVMSEESKKFITPLTFEALTREKVLHKESESWSNGNNHIELAAWGDLFLIAPATANTINALAYGLSGNLLSDTYLAFDKKVLIAPSANEKMFLKPQTSASLKKLEGFGCEIVAPIVKELACGVVGMGGLEEVDEIIFRVIKALTPQYYADKKVVVTGGGSSEEIDSVRYIGNRSSGKMASNIVLNLYFQGADVVFITSKTPYLLPKGVSIIDVSSAIEFQVALREQLSTGDLLIMCAAIADFVPIQKIDGKIKKEDTKKLFLELELGVDILSSIKGIDCVKIGFKAESDRGNGLLYAKKALEGKGLDGIALNFITDETFGGDENEIIFLTKDAQILIEKDTKFNIAKNLISQIKTRCLKN